MIPEAAVQRDDQASIVFVPAGPGRFARRIVTLGPPADSGWVTVTAGVAVGDSVVTTGAFVLRIPNSAGASSAKERSSAMVERLLEWSLRNRFLVLTLALLLIGGGAWAMRGLPIDAVPDVTNVQVQVLTTAPALGPEEVERFITTPVELAMSGLPGLTELRSISRFGLSAVTVAFEDGTDIYFARQLVNERLQGAREDIPPGYGTPEMGPISTGLGEIYQFVIQGDGKSPMELRTILEWDVAPRLRQVPGVIEVNAFGGELRTYEVALRPERLGAYGVSLSQLFEALERNNANAGGAYIEKNAEQYLIRGEGLIGTLQDIGDIVVTSDARDGTPVYVRQLADVRFAPMVRQGAVTQDGNGEVVTGIVLMLLGANSREVVSQVKAAVNGHDAGAGEAGRAGRAVLRPDRTGEEDDRHGHEAWPRGRCLSSSCCSSCSATCAQASLPRV